MEQYIEAIKRNGTWELVPRLANRNVIVVKRVFKTKYHNEGSLDKHKARLVAKGYAQHLGFSYHDTFAPTSHMAMIHSILAIASSSNTTHWPVYQMDVMSIFLSYDLREEVYVD